MQCDARVSPFDTALEAKPAERLIAPPGPAGRRERPIFVGLFGICLLIHAMLFALLLREDVPVAPIAAQEQEIPIEVIVETPPEKPIEPAKPKEPPPKIKMEEDYEKPAFDAPRAANKETIERDAPDKETKAAHVAAPNENAAPKPALRKDASPAQEAKPEPPAPSAPEKQADATPDAKILPDAEILEDAAPAPQPKPEKKQPKTEAKVPPKQTMNGSVADQIAALAPLPDYQLGSAARPAPVSGGTAKTTYLSILYGLIMPRFHFSPSAHARHNAGPGIVAFYIDEIGNLTHQAVMRSSGLPDLDAAAIAAVRRAAPFPAPPRGHPRSILFQYGPR